MFDYQIIKVGETILASCKNGHADTVFFFKITIHRKKNDSIFSKQDRLTNN